MGSNRGVCQRGVTRTAWQPYPLAAQEDPGEPTWRKVVFAWHTACLIQTRKEKDDEGQNRFEGGYQR